jgi:hypothetical protein
MNQSISAEQQKKYGQLVAKAWSDEEFKRKLLSDPVATLAAAGLPAPAGFEVRVVESTDKIVYLVLPPKPPEGQLSDEQLHHVSGSACSVSSCNYYCG